MSFSCFSCLPHFFKKTQENKKMDSIEKPVVGTTCSCLSRKLWALFGKKWHITSWDLILSKAGKSGIYQKNISENCRHTAEKLIFLVLKYFLWKYRLDYDFWSEFFSQNARCPFSPKWYQRENNFLCVLIYSVGLFSPHFNLCGLEKVQFQVNSYPFFGLQPNYSTNIQMNLLTACRAFLATKETTMALWKTSFRQIGLFLDLIYFSLKTTRPNLRLRVRLILQHFGRETLWTLVLKKVQLLTDLPLWFEYYPAKTIWI